jgi:signal transduction histidine kinase
MPRKLSKASSFSQLKVIQETQETFQNLLTRAEKHDIISPSISQIKWKGNGVMHGIYGMNTYRNRKRVRKFLAVAVSLCFVAIFVLTSVLTVVHAGHSCAGIETVCSVCPAIIQNQKVTEQIISIAILAFIAGIALALSAMFAHIRKSDLCTTPVQSLFATKTRFNN